MKIPGRELAIVLVGLAVLVAAWMLVFMSTQERRRGRSADAGAQVSESATEETAPTEKPTADVTEKPAE